MWEPGDGDGGTRSGDWPRSDRRRAGPLASGLPTDGAPQDAIGAHDWCSPGGRSPVRAERGAIARHRPTRREDEFMSPLRHDQSRPWRSEGEHRTGPLSSWSAAKSPRRREPSRTDLRPWRRQTRWHRSARVAEDRIVITLSRSRDCRSTGDLTRRSGVERTSSCTTGPAPGTSPEACSRTRSWRRSHEGSHG